ncbi:hypothetical protein ACIRBX_25175 [Kitasatospora sp. NPDC096147]|uniref:hypothetical protein n=1 Tax=Kitasatospora sp. NPDC096147 TaxID=3364093 RepID=UPI0038138E72
MRSFATAARLSALLTPALLLWAMSDGGPDGWERIALIAALLRAGRDATVHWSRLTLR